MAGTRERISADAALGLESDGDRSSGDNFSDTESRANITHQRVDDDDEQENDFSDGEDEPDRLVNRSVTKRSHFNAFEQEEDDEEEESENEKKNEDEANESSSKLSSFDAFEREAFNDLTKESKITKKLKLKKLTPEQLEKTKKKILRTGVIYISKIPPYMKPLKMRQVLSRFGEIDRLFLKPEDVKTYHKRVKYGGNKKRSYIEGWAEFVNKKDAKLCEHTLNGNILGGKKGSFYYDDVMNIKYIKGFKWTDLTEQITKENESRQAKLQAELSQVSKVNKAFIANVEKSKMIANMQKKKKERNQQGDEGKEQIEVRRNFVQREVSSKRADAPDHIKSKKANSEKLDNVLSSIF